MRAPSAVFSAASASCSAASAFSRDDFAVWALLLASAAVSFNFSALRRAASANSASLWAASAFLRASLLFAAVFLGPRQLSGVLLLQPLQLVAPPLPMQT